MSAPWLKLLFDLSRDAHCVSSHLKNRHDHPYHDHTSFDYPISIITDQSIHGITIRYNGANPPQPPSPLSPPNYPKARLIKSQITSHKRQTASQRSWAHALQRSPWEDGVPSRVASPCEASSSEVAKTEIGADATASESAERVLTRKMKPLRREERRRRGGEEEEERGNERRGEK